MNEEKKIVPLDNIIRVIPKEELELPEMAVVIEEKPGPYCPHEQVKAFPFYRTLQCVRCGKTLEPFDYIMHLGSKERNLQTNLRILHYEVKHRQEEKAKLEKEISYLKQQKKKLL
jgi:hypothetical protein